MSTSLLIAGAGGHGRVVADIAVVSGQFTSVAFLDDRHPGLVLGEGWAVAGSLGDLEKLRERYDHFVAAFGDASLRLTVLDRARHFGFNLVSLIHPSAVVSRYATIGPGVIIAAGAIVNIGARIGRGCIINTAASVDHDCELEEGVHVCPGARLAGNVRIGRQTWFGIGATARQGIRIGCEVVVGAGGVVVKDVADGLSVVGNPAKVRKSDSHANDAE